MPRNYRYDRSHEEDKARADRCIALGVDNPLSHAIKRQIADRLGRFHCANTPHSAARHIMRELSGENESVRVGYRKAKQQFPKRAFRRHIFRLCLFIHLQHKATWVSVMGRRYLSHTHKAWATFEDSRGD